MDAYILEWLQVILRSLHIITGIAWIGASFYFVWLDNHLHKPAAQDLKDKGVDGELWAVHGGGFYNPQKYMVAPKSLPQDLHWFYWESYSTWMSGFALFVTLYLMNAKTMMVDSKVSDISGATAVGYALGILVVGWVIYDVVCRVFESRDKLVGLIVAVMVTITAYLTCHIFAARAAFLITGAMMATIMTANVFFVIIPGQRKVIKSMRAGETVDPIHGKRGKQRSVHNTYFTLPVLFAMLSNHFHMIYSVPDAWLMLVVMMAASVLIRHYFVLRHKGLQHWWLLTAATTMILGVAVHLAPAPTTASAAAGPAVKIDDVLPIVLERCSPCHAEQPLMVAAPPKGLKLENREAIEANAAIIYQQVVVQKIMPLGNATQMTDDERMKIKSWFESR
jgi:uncharacterized membrane protein